LGRILFLFDIDIDDGFCVGGERGGVDMAVGLLPSLCQRHDARLEMLLIIVKCLALGFEGGRLEERLSLRKSLGNGVRPVHCSVAECLSSPSLVRGPGI
jgi:hypothetical protein